MRLRRRLGLLHARRDRRCGRPGAGDWTGRRCRSRRCRSCRRRPRRDTAGPGEPRPPAPMNSTFDCCSLAWPSGPTSGMTRWRLVARLGRDRRAASTAASTAGPRLPAPIPPAIEIDVLVAHAAGASGRTRRAASARRCAVDDDRLASWGPATTPLDACRDVGRRHERRAGQMAGVPLVPARGCRAALRPRVDQLPDGLGRARSRGPGLRTSSGWRVATRRGP